MAPTLVAIGLAMIMSSFSRFAVDNGAYVGCDLPFDVDEDQTTDVNNEDHTTAINKQHLAATVDNQDNVTASRNQDHATANNNATTANHNDTDDNNNKRRGVYIDDDSVAHTCGVGEDEEDDNETSFQTGKRSEEIIKADIKRLRTEQQSPLIRVREPNVVVRGKEEEAGDSSKD